ncbi:MAG: DUF389 domain-containing protein [Dissulfurispiraceae bacterium]|nr:DUF389 domain-containing protein [Dissulfurispiraceae bacterium]
MRKSDLLKKIIRLTNLRGQLDSFDTIHSTIQKEIIFKGTTLWILMCAIILASVGLNMNSTAVIIGAMLISPLMGPINGMGYSIATYDFKLFRKAAKNLSFAVLASLTASTLYFSISPVSTAHSELLARTSPTIYDVLIALFGGMAGIIAISSKLKGNVIPGVAIATALMPPLCTAGYGLATAQFVYFFGAFYLFTINAVFIALSAVVVSRIFKFPIRTVVDEGSKARVNSWISAVILVTVIPSIYFGYGLVEKERFAENAAKFARSVSVVEGAYLLKNDVIPRSKTIALVYGGSSLSDKHKELIRQRAREFNLSDAKLDFQQGFSFEGINLQANELNTLKTEINRLTLIVRAKEREIEELTNKPFIGRQLLSELRALYPQIISCSYSDAFEFDSSSVDPKNLALILVKAKKNSLKLSDKKKVSQWLEARLETTSVKVYFEN